MRRVMTRCRSIRSSIAWQRPANQTSSSSDGASVTSASAVAASAAGARPAAACAANQGWPAICVGATSGTLMRRRRNFRGSAGTAAAAAAGSAAARGTGSGPALGGCFAAGAPDATAAAAAAGSGAAGCWVAFAGALAVVVDGTAASAAARLRACRQMPQRSQTCDFALSSAENSQRTPSDSSQHMHIKTLRQSEEVHTCSSASAAAWRSR